MSVNVSLTPQKTLRVVFPFHETDKSGSRLGQTIGAATGARWSRPMGGWEIYPSDLTQAALEQICSPIWGEGCLEVIRKAAKVGKDLEADFNSGFAQVPSAELLKELLPHLKRKAMKHQENALSFTQARKQYALFMEMGTGKTKVAIDDACARFAAKEIEVLIVLCPKSLVFNWVQELKKDMWESVPFLGWALEGSSREKALQIQECRESLEREASERLKRPTGNLHVIVGNYDALLSAEVEGGLADIISAYPSAVICDESTRIKHSTTHRTKAACRIGRHAKVRGILTGSPITESREDIYGQYQFLDPSIYGNSYVAFRARYCVMGGYQGKEIVGYQNVEEYTRRMYRRAFRVTKAECLDLPPKVYEMRQFKMPEDMARAHQEMAQKLVTELKGREFKATIILTKMLRLQEITSGYLKDGDIIHALKHSPKMDLLEEILEEFDGKAIVWCREIEEISQVVQRLTKMGLGVFQLHGAIKDREAQVEGFRHHPGRAVMVMNQMTGGMGLTLTEATLAVYVSNPTSRELRIQSEDRCHRKGQAHKVTYIDLVAEKSVDDLVLKMLADKGRMAEDALAIRKALEKMVAHG